MIGGWARGFGFGFRLGLGLGFGFGFGLGLGLGLGLGEHGVQGEHHRAEVGGGEG